MPELTDQQVVAACARAMGQDLFTDSCGQVWVGATALEAYRSEKLYDPLTDRAQAMELVEKLGMSIEFDDEMKTWFASQWSDSNVCIEDANLLRAICLCAARVQIEKEKNANG